jgi:hypothetical protein
MIVWGLTFLLIVSVLCLSIFIWYITQLLERFKYLSDNSSNLLEVVGDYKEHLQKVYELPMFYGDETLRGLLKHTKDLAQDLDDLSEMFYMGEKNQGEFIDEETEG